MCDSIGSNGEIQTEYFFIGVICTSVLLLVVLCLTFFFKISATTNYCCPTSCYTCLASSVSFILGMSAIKCSGAWCFSYNLLVDIGGCRASILIHQLLIQILVYWFFMTITTPTTAFDLLLLSTSYSKAAIYYSVMHTAVASLLQFSYPGWYFADWILVLILPKINCCNTMTFSSPTATTTTTVTIWFAASYASFYAPTFSTASYGLLQASLQ